MNTIHNVYDQAKLSPEAYLRIIARILEEEAIEWRRSFAYKGKPVCQAVTMPGTYTYTTVGILKGGYKGRTWVQIIRRTDRAQLSPRISMKPGCARTIYVHLAEALDATETV